MIRIWKLGNSDKGILPTQEGVDKLKKLLKDMCPAGTTDIVWDDMLTVTIIDDNGHVHQ